MLATVIAGLLGPSITNAMIAIGVISTPAYARIARSAVAVIKAEPYVEAAQVVGGGTLRISGRHILPNIAPPLIVQTSLLFSTAVLAEAALSFLGLGIQPPDPSWGSMLNASRQFMELRPGSRSPPASRSCSSSWASTFWGTGCATRSTPACARTDPSASQARRLAGLPSKREPR